VTTLRWLRSTSFALAAVLAGALAPAAARDGGAEQKGPAMIGGYEEHPGTCTILAVEQTAQSMAQETASGGPGYPGYEVAYSFSGPEAGDNALMRNALADRHTLRLTNSWYPGRRFLKTYGIAAGKMFSCTLKVITKGTCTPTLFDFPDIDRSNYFESGR
jgi:hypothetical protein